MGRTGCRAASRDTHSVAVVGVAKERTAFDNALERVRIAWIIILSRSTRVATNLRIVSRDNATETCRAASSDTRWGDNSGSDDCFVFISGKENSPGSVAPSRRRRAA